MKRNKSKTSELAEYFWFEVLGLTDPYRSNGFLRYMAEAKRVLSDETLDTESLKRAWKTMTGDGIAVKSMLIAFTFIKPNSGGKSYYDFCHDAVDDVPPIWDVYAHLEYEAKHGK